MGNAASGSSEGKDVVPLSVKLGGLHGGIGGLIIDHLNLKDKINVFTIEELRQFFAPRHAKSVILSRTTLGTAKTLQTDFILHMGVHVHELNLSCVKNLTPVVFTQAINLLKNLKILDVTYTNVFLHDLVEAGLPEKLEELSISVQDSYWLWDISNGRNLKSIHFVVYNYADVEKICEFIKNIPSTNGLKVKITVISIRHHQDILNDMSDPQDEQPRLSDTTIYFKELTLLVMHDENDHEIYKHMDGIRELDYNQLEYIFMMFTEELIIYSSQALRPLFTASVGEQIQIKVCEKPPLDWTPHHNTPLHSLPNGFLFKVWNKCSTSFDEDFFRQVLEELKEYLPQFVCMHCDSPKIISVIKSESDWYCIDCDGFENKFESLPSKITLTTTCIQKNDIKRGYTFSISLSPKSSLKNITLLSMDTSTLADNFFVVLFQCCKLQTLDIIGPLVGFDEAVQFANNLKNIRQDDHIIDFELLFANLSRCPSLENIHICESYEYELREEVEIEKNKMTLITINLITMIANCKELCSLYIETDSAVNTLYFSCIPHIVNDYTHIVFSKSVNLQTNPFANVFAASELPLNKIRFL